MSHRPVVAAVTLIFFWQAAVSAQSSRVGQVIRDQFQGREIQIEITAPLAPDDALKTIHVKPGFRVELVAAEPLIVDPVAFDWGPDGRLWVVEMRDYPNGLDWHGPADQKNKPGGRVKVLRDKDGDGRYDEATTFLDNLSFPTGIKVWHKGVLVTAAPEIIYAEDTNGDNVADVISPLFRGFGEGNQQHRVNGLRWGYDGWLYVGNGDSGGRIKSLLTGEELNISGRDLRINPETGAMEAQSGQTQFGRDRDDFGNWFGGNNSNPIWHYVLDDHYLRRNPNLAAPDVKRHISKVPGPAPVFPKSKTLARFNDFDRANRFTSACSPMIYRDTLLGDDFYGNCFICEPVHNLVHREIVQPDGLSFVATRSEDEASSEFLASTDSWFRPVMCRTGPDGALYIADMYRFVIEHPQWIPEGVQRQIDLKLGDDKGRIYRVFHESAPPRPFVRLDQLEPAKLAAAIDSPNGPQRDLAQQMLLWNKSPDAIPVLTDFATKATLPQVRVQALATLTLLDALKEETLLAALRDSHAGVQKEAVRLSEPLLAESAQVRAAVGELVSSDSLPIRLQVAYSAGAVRQGADGLRWAAQVLKEIRQAHNGDRFLQLAVLSSLHRDNVAVLIEEVLTSDQDSAASEALFEAALPLLQVDALRNVASKIMQPEPADADGATLRRLGTLLKIVQRRDRPREQQLGLDLTRRTEAYFAVARRLAESQPEDRATRSRRVEAIELLGQSRSNEAADLQLLGRLLRPQEGPETHSAALLALVQRGAKDTPRILLADWQRYTPQQRANILNVLLVREDWTDQLLAAMEAGQLEASQLDAARRQTLLVHKSPALRQRAEKLFSAGSADRREVLETHQDVLKLTPDVVRGRKVFAKSCAPCHKIGDVGHDVGPNLAALSDRSPPVMLTAILDPNRAVEDKFRVYQVLLLDGRILSGMLAVETSTSLTIAGPEGKQTTILRSEIEELRATGKSLMPDGLERDLTKQDLADLLGLLQGLKREQ
jgi:putative membrane-bound dehydrogenase-like protein